jgi:hypothetical protein
MWFLFYGRRLPLSRHWTEILANDKGLRRDPATWIVNIATQRAGRLLLAGPCG